MISRQVQNQEIIDAFLADNPAYQVCKIRGQALSNTSGGRIKYIDFLKGIAIIGVIMIHVCGTLITSDDGSFAWRTYVVYDALSRFAVPVFFMCSGVLLLNNEKEMTFKRVMKYEGRILLALFIYGGIYRIYHFLVGETAYTSLISTILHIPYDFLTCNAEFHFWYLYAMVCIYLTLPVVKVFTDKATKNQLEYFLALWWILSVVEYLIQFEVLLPLTVWTNSMYYFSGFFGYTGFMVLGVYLSRYGIDKKRVTLVRFAAVAGLVFSTILTIYQRLVTGSHDDLLDYYSPFIILCSVCIFDLCKSMKLTDGTITKGFCYLGKNSLGIYMIHMVFVFVLVGCNILSINICPIIAPLVYAILVLIPSIIVSWLIKRVPVIGKRIV